MGNWFPVGKVGATTTYVSQQQCEDDEGQACYDITGKDPRYHDVVDGELVENLTKKAEVLAAEASLQSLSVAISMKNLCDALVPDGVNITQGDIDAFQAKLAALIGE